eukprot:16433550-Heterocapsa_arctica.AAC.2
MASQGKALSSFGPHPSIPAALPAFIRRMISHTSSGRIRRSLGMSATQVAVNITSFCGGQSKV